eukprot:11186803-Lingulodinium_polyedra.AAC.1
MRGAAPTVCVFERVSEQFPARVAQTCVQTRIPLAAPRVSQRARSTCWPPRGGRRAECANCELRGATAM